MPTSGSFLSRSARFEGEYPSAIVCWILGMWHAMHSLLALPVLHPILMPRALREMREGGLAELGIFELQKLSSGFPRSKPTGQS